MHHYPLGNRLLKMTLFRMILNRFCNDKTFLHQRPMLVTSNRTIICARLQKKKGRGKLPTLTFLKNFARITFNALLSIRTQDVKYPWTGARMLPHQL